MLKLVCDVVEFMHEDERMGGNDMSLKKPKLGGGGDWPAFGGHKPLRRLLKEACLCAVLSCDLRCVEIC